MLELVNEAAMTRLANQYLGTTATWWQMRAEWPLDFLETVLGLACYKPGEARDEDDEDDDEAGDAASPESEAGE